MIKIKCNWCKQIFTKRGISYIRKYNFCSVKCRGKWQSKHQKGENNPNFKKSPIKVKCHFCKKVFYRQISFLRNKKYHYCGNFCKNKGHSKLLHGTYGSLIKRVQIKCNWCKKYISRIPSAVKKNAHNFCGLLCRNKWYSKHRLGKNGYNYIHGKSRKRYPLEFTNEKEQIRRRDGYKCQKCGITQKTNIIKYGKKLSIHHIDYNKFNSNPTLLISLCYKCHGKTNTNRDYWFAYFSCILEEPYRKEIKLSKILNWKEVRNIGKAHQKQTSKEFLELLDRKIYERIEKIITGVRFKRLTSKDLIQ